MVRDIYRRKGFTLIELLIATAIMLLIIGGTMTIYLMSITAWQEGSMQIVLQRKGSIAMEKMVRGVDGRNGIREAKAGSVTCVNTTSEKSIQYTTIDGKKRKFYLSGSEIIYDPDTLTPGDHFSIAKYVETPSVDDEPLFAVSGNIVTINLVMEEEVMDKPINVDLSTQVKLRN